MNRITDFLTQALGISAANQAKVLYSILILVVVGALRFVLLKIIWRSTEDPKSRYTWKRSVSFTLGFISVILIFVLIGIFTTIALMIAEIVFIIIASIKANGGEHYKYPMTITFIK